MKVALVHDYLIQYGGAERVLEAFCEIFPNAPIFTMAYDEKATNGAFKSRKIHTSFLQKIPLISSHHRAYPLLMPLAIEQFDFSDFDIVLSDSNSYAKGIITGPETLHISYCHTPMRYAWDDCHRHMREFDYSKITKKLLPFGISYLRMWDSASSDRPDFYIANSKFVKERIKKYYKRESEVIYPPVNINNFNVSNKIEDFYLLIGRALPYKRFDIAIQAFNELGLNLKIIGKGPEIERLKKISRDNIDFLGYLDDKTASGYYSKCKALIFPSEEDFGITPLEAMASGRPVIAYRGGGALETVIDKETGIFFQEQTPESIIKAVGEFKEKDFSPEQIRKYAEGYNKENFKKNIRNFIEDKYNNYKKQYGS